MKDKVNAIYARKRVFDDFDKANKGRRFVQHILHTLQDSQGSVDTFDDSFTVLLLSINCKNYS